jgi:hypothetical protein
MVPNRRSIALRPQGWPVTVKRGYPGALWISCTSEMTLPTFQMPLGGV